MEKKPHAHQLWEGTQHSGKRGLHACVPGGSRVLFLAGFIFGAVGMRAAFVADKGFCPPKGLPNFFYIHRASVYLRAREGPEMSKAPFLSSGWSCPERRAEHRTLKSPWVGEGRLP